MMKTSNIPQAFLEKIRSVLPETDCQKFEKSCLTRLRKSIRVNTLKISVADFQKRAQRKGWKLEQIPWCREGFWIDRSEQEQRSIPLGKTGAHLLGLFYIQEASSMLPVAALFPHTCSGDVDGSITGDTTYDACVLDMAAAPGSKTTQLAAIMKNLGLIVANEFSASRIKKLFSNLERSGVQNVALSHLDGTKFARLAPTTFDAILLDAPCTGEGTIRKDPKALQNWSERRINISAGVQKQLIIAAFEALKPNGILVYSTCTFAPEENESICLYLRDRFGDAVEFDSLKHLFPEAEKCVTSEGFLRIWPHVLDTEGFFIARIRKNTQGETRYQPSSRLRPTSRLVSTKINPNFPFSQTSLATFQTLQKYYEQHFGFSLSFAKKSLRGRDREIWLFPEGVDTLLSQIRFDRIGIKLCEIHSKGMKTLHEMAITLGGRFTKNVYELSAEEANDFYAGKDVSSKPGAWSQEQGEVLLTFEGFPLGMGKIQGGKIKNQLPRKVVREGVVFG